MIIKAIDKINIKKQDTDLCGDPKKLDLKA